MNEELRARIYKNTMEMVSLNQLLDLEAKAFEAAHADSKPDFAKLSIISSRMAILFHKLDVVFKEKEEIQKELERFIFE